MRTSTLHKYTLPIFLLFAREADLDQETHQHNQFPVICKPPFQPTGSMLHLCHIRLQHILEAGQDSLRIVGGLLLQSAQVEPRSRTGSNTGTFYSPCRSMSSVVVPDQGIIKTRDRVLCLLNQCVSSQRLAYGHPIVSFVSVGVYH